jgi:tetratricopeptide (TPR) repeat protein
MNKIFLLLFILLPSLSFADKITINSDPPESTVYVRELGNTNYKKLGKAPLETSFEELKTYFVNTAVFMIEVRKKGYLPYRVTVNDLAKAEMGILVNLEPREDFLKYSKIDKNIAELFEAQRLMRAQQYDEAINILRVVGDKEPYLSIVPEFIGSAYYLKKQNRKSLDFYKKAYRINPENRDAFTMKNYLEKALGVTKAGQL